MREVVLVITRTATEEVSRQTCPENLAIHQLQGGNRLSAQGHLQTNNPQLLLPAPSSALNAVRLHRVSTKKLTQSFWAELTLIFKTTTLSRGNKLLVQGHCSEVNTNYCCNISIITNLRPLKTFTA